MTLNDPAKNNSETDTPVKPTLNTMKDAPNSNMAFDAFDNRGDKAAIPAITPTTIPIKIARAPNGA